MLYADGAYAGLLEDIVSYFYELHLHIVKKLANQKGFVVLPKRWIVERTLAWFSKNRRLSKDYEFQPQSSEAMIRWAMIARMARWLTKAALPNFCNLSNRRDGRKGRNTLPANYPPYYPTLVSNDMTGDTL